MLSSQHHTPIDVSTIIEVLQNTLDFEHDLHKRFQHAVNGRINVDDMKIPGTGGVKVDKSGKVTIDAGSAQDIKDKYGESVEGVLSKNYERIRGKTRMSAHIYRFKGCISECFEPYLKSYSESEERKIIEAIESAMTQDKLETIDYTVFGSSLHLFKNIKGSLKRCLSFSTSKAFFDLHTSFKNVFRHYCRLLKRHLPAKLGTE